MTEYRQSSQSNKNNNKIMTTIIMHKKMQFIQKCYSRHRASNTAKKIFLNDRDITQHHTT